MHRAVGRSARRRHSPPRWLIATGAGAAIVALTTCRVDQLVSPPTTGTPVVAPAALFDSAAVGSLAEHQQTVQITNGGSGTLDWTARRAQGSAWLVLDAASGTAPSNVTLTFKPSDLPVGAYHDTIVVAAAGNTTDPTRLPVTFVIRPCSVDTVAIGAVLNDSLTTSDCAAPHHPNRFAHLYTFRGNANDSVTVTVTQSAFAGMLLLDSGATPAVPPLASASDCDGVAGPPCLRYVRLPRPAYYTVEATSDSTHTTGAFSLTLTPPRAPNPPTSPAQFASDSTTPIAAGGSIGDSTIVLAAAASDSDAGDEVRLDAEVRRVGVEFTDVATDSGSMVPAGGTARVLVHGLADDSSYHWQVRVTDETGRSGAWLPFGSGNADVRVAVAQAPNAPGGLEQLKSDGSTAIAVGDTTDEHTVLFRATVSDPDPGDSLRLDVEVQPLGTAFSGTVTASSVPVANGQTATTSVGALVSGTQYHWRARVTDETDRHSAWAAFGGNAESAADFTVEAGANHLTYLTGPTTVAAGATISPPIVVAAQTLSGATDTSYAGTITLAIASGTGTGGATLSGTLQRSAQKGKATFNDVSIDRAGTAYRLTASSGALANTTSDPFNVTAGAAGKLAITTQPAANARSGVGLSTQPVVRLENAFGDTVAQSGVSITATVASGPSGSTLAGASAATDAAGVATFSGLAISGSVGKYTLQFANGSIVVESDTVTLAAGPAAKLTVAQQPSSTAQSGIAFATQPKIQLVDGAGNSVQQSGVSVAAAIASGGGTLQGTSSVTTNASGLATFTNLAIAGATGVRTLGFSATAAGLTGATSGTITVGSGTATTIAIAAGDGQVAQAGTTVPVAPSVLVTDASSNPVAGVAVTFAVASGGGAVVPTTAIATGADGKATVTSWTLGTTAGTNTLTATAAGLSGSPLTFTANGTAGAPGSLSITTQPSPTAQAGIALSTQPLIQVKDGSGNPVPQSGITVTATVSGGGTLLGSKTVATDGTGKATFTDLAIGGTVGAYTLSFSSGGVIGATSNTITLSAGTATQVVLSTAPSTTVIADSVFPKQPVAQVADAYGNAVATPSAKTITATSNPTGLLTGTRQVQTNASGTATYTNLALTGDPGDRTISFVAVGTSWGPATSPTIQVVIGSPFADSSTATVPSGTAGSVTSIAVVARDSAGTDLIRGGATVVVQVTGANTAAPSVVDNGNGSYSASYTPTAAGMDKVAITLNGKAIRGSPYSSSVVAGGPSASQSTATVGAGTAGSATPITVTVRDASGNKVAGQAANLAAAVTGANAGKTVSAFTQQSDSTYRATYTPTASGRDNVAITLSANAIGGSPYTSAVSAGPASPTQTTASVPAGTAGTATPITVTVRDANGNKVTGQGGNIAVTVTGTNAGKAVGTFTQQADTTYRATYTPTSAGTDGFAITLSGTTIGGGPYASAVGPGAATKLVFTQGPSNVTAGVAISPAISVAVEDANSNVVTGYATNITLAIGTNAGGGTLKNGGSVAPAGGVATYGTASINKIGTGYTLTATSGTLTSATSAAFNVTAAPADSLRAVTSTTLTGTVGTAVSPAPTVIVVDSLGNPVSGVSVTFAASGDGSATSPVNTGTNGQAATSWTLGSASGAQTLSVTSTGLVGSPVTFNATAGAGSAGGLTMFTQPSGTAQSGVVLGTQPVVQLRDTLGNVVNTSGVAVTASIASGPAGSLGGTATVNTNSSGQAVFSNLSIIGPAGTYTLGFSGSGLSGVSSTGIALSAGAASQLVLTTQPSATVQSGVAFPTQPVLQVEDAAGNPVSGTRSILAGINSGGGALGGSASINTNASGVATFTNLSISGTIGARTLLFSSSGLSSATSNSIAVNPGLPSASASSATVGAGTAGAATPITVTIRDASSNKVPGQAANLAGSVTGANAGKTVSPFTQQADSTYTASYTPTASGTDNVAITVNASAIGGSPYTTAVSAGAASAGQTSAAIPAGTAGTATPITVTVRDANGNKVTGQQGNIAVTVTGSNAGKTVSAFAQQADSTYRATYTPTAVGSDGFTITLNSTAIGGGPYSSAVSAGAATHLAFTQGPTNVTAGVAISPAITVTALDANNNVATGYATGITLAFGTNAGGGTLANGGPVTPVSGVATYGTTSITKIGTGYTLTASSGSLTGATSPAFNVTAAPADSLRAASPTTLSGTVGTAVSPAPAVIVVDSLGNPVSGVSVTFVPSAGSVGTQPVTTGTNGQATTTWTLGTASGAQTLSATAAGLVGSPRTFTATANAGTASASQTTASIPAGTAGTATPITVTVRDASNNKVTGQAANLAATVTGTNAGATVSAFTQQPDSTYRATYTPAKSGTDGFTITLSSTTIGGGPYSSVVSAGAATKLVFTQGPPASVTAGVSMSPAITVAAEDANNNVVPTYATGITLAIGTNAGSGTLKNGGSVTPVNGVATYGTASINKIGTGYTLTAMSGTLTSATSGAFNVTAAPADTLRAFSNTTLTGTVSTAVTPAPTVIVVDSLGNPVSGVNVTFTPGTGGGTVGTQPVATSANGQATTTWTLGAATGAQSLSAAATVPNGSPVSFNATAGAGAPSATLTTASVPAGTAGTPTPITVTVRDANGNKVTGQAANLAVTVTGSNAGAAVSAFTPRADSTYRATYTPTKSGSDGFTITVNGNGIGGGPYTSTVSPGAAAKLVFTQAPSDVTAGVAISPAIKVTAEDANNNVVPSYATGITLAIGTNPGGGSIKNPGPVTPSAGVATFGTTAINKIGTGYTLIASSGTLTSATSAAFNVTAAPADSLRAVTSTTLTGTVNTAVSPAPVVIVVDSLGNPVSGASVTFTPSAGTVGTQPVTTATNGQATTPWTLGGSSGTQTLSAAATGLIGSPVTFSATVGAGSATKLIFTQGPTNVTAGVPFSPTITVSAVDASNNVVTSYATNITLAIGTNAGSGALKNGGSVTPVNGVATYTGASINKIGTGYTLTAASGTLTGATSGTFNVTAAPADSIRAVSTTTLTGTVGTAVTPAPTVIVVDSLGNPVSGTSVAFAASGDGSATSPVTTSTNGQAATSWTLGTTAGAQTLSATVVGLVGSPVAFSATASAGSAGRLSVSTEPSGTAQSGNQLGTQPIVQLQDVNGNNVNTSGVAITASLASGPAGTLNGTVTVNTNSSGQAVFTNLSITGPTGTYTLGFSGTGLSGTSSSNIVLSAGTATQLVFTTPPSSSVQSGVAFPTQPVLQVEDAAGNPVSTTKTVLANINSGGGVLGGTTSISTNASGVATYTNLVISGTVGDRTLLFSSSGLTSATSGTITVTPGNPSASSSSATVGAGTAGVATPITVTVRDASNNKVPGQAANLAGTVTGANTKTVSAFTQQTDSTYAASYTPTAAGTDNVAITLSSNAISGSPYSSTVSPGPASAAQTTASVPAGTAGTPTPITVTVRDANNNKKTGQSANLTAIVTGPNAGKAVSAFTQQADSTYRATYTPTVSGTDGFTISLGDTTIGGGPYTSTVSPGAAAKLVFTQAPSDVTAGVAISPAITVSAEDANNNVVPSYATGITLAIGTNPGGGSIKNPGPVTPSAGVATFGTTAINKIGTGYTLIASSGTLTSATSAAFNVTAAPADSLRAVTSTTLSGTVNTAVSPAPVVIVVDSLGNPVSGASVTFTPNGGTVGTQPVTTGADGQATTSWTLGATSGTQTLSASATGLVGSPRTFTATANAGAATAAQTTAIVPAGTAGTATPITVTVRDASNNKVLGEAANLAATVGGSNAGRTVSAFTPQSDSTYLANYTPTASGSDDIAITLSSAAIGGSPYTSAVSPGAAAKLVFTQGPTNVTAGVAISPAITVTAEDANNNAVPTYATGITLAIGNNAGGGTLKNGGLATPASGAATYGTASINKIGTGYTLTATSGTLTSATSAAFNVTAAPADTLRATTDTILADTAGALVTPAPAVIVVDSLGNPVSGVSVTFGTSDGSIGTQPVTTGTGGLASTPWTLATTLGAQALTATATGLFGSPITFRDTVRAGNASVATSTITPSPASLTADGTSTSTITVRLKDVNGNNLAASGGTVALGNTLGALGAVTDNGDGTYTATLTAATTAGTDTITATLDGADLADTLAVAFTPGPLDHFVVDTAGGGAITTVTAGTPFNIEVIAKDANSNTVTGFTGTANITSSGTLSAGATTAAFSAGVLASHSVTITSAGAGVTITATNAAGSQTGTSAGFTVNPGAATTLSVSGIADPSTTAVASDVTVTARDQFGNTATGYTGTIKFTSSDGLASLPPDYTFTGVDAGTHTFTGGVTFVTPGSQSVTATDSVTGTITGSQTVQVN